MNRTIKFRAWDKRLKRMWYFGEIQTSGIVSDKGWAPQMYAEAPPDISTLGIRIFAPSKDEFVYLEWTGLLDKNGKEIYEGDIVCHVEDVTVEVIGGYERREPEGIFTEVKIPNIYVAVGNDLPDANELEILGNIYSNPELLK